MSKNKQESKPEIQHIKHLEIARTLNNYAKRGKQLRTILFFAPFPLNHPDDAKNYLDLHAEYNFICKLFGDIGVVGNWWNMEFEE